VTLTGNKSYSHFPQPKQPCWICFVLQIR